MTGRRPRPSIGPSLGGWITDSYSWRWIFYLNIPVGILAYVLVTRLVDDPPWIKPDRKHLLNMDYMGLAFLTLAWRGCKSRSTRRREQLVLLELHPLLRCHVSCWA